MRTVTTCWLNSCGEQSHKDSVHRTNRWEQLKRRLPDFITTHSFWTFTTNIGGSCHKYHFCRDKSFAATNTCFVATKVWLPLQNVCRAKHNFVATKYLCCDKHVFVATSILLLRQNTCFVATKIILVAYVWRQKFCRDKHTFVATNTCLSRQKLHLLQPSPMIDKGLTRTSILTGQHETCRHFPGADESGVYWTR